MPRQDVPYGGAICRLRERIAEIFDKLGEKLHTINGVPGDGDGNVKIVSGSSAVVISNDPTQNEIAVSLDTSQLPAAAVSSVNGQTGAVVLNAENIASDGGFDVQADIDALNIKDGTLQSNINAEALARQGADSTLQTNINAVQAGIPAAAAAAVAADPTVAYISSELSNKVDLSDVSTIETPDTIAKRNGSGRLVAADPASGATDKTLVTANWISQTGAGRPNNVIHNTGNESKSGTMTFDDPVYGRLIKPLYENYNGTLPTGKYRIFARIPAAMTNTMAYLDVMTSANGFNFAFGILLVGNPTSTSWLCRWALRKDNGTFLTANSIQIAKETATGDLLVFAKNPTTTGLSINLRYAKSGSSIHGADRIVAYYDGVDYTLDGSDAGITDIVAGVDM